MLLCRSLCDSYLRVVRAHVRVAECVPSPLRFLLGFVRRTVARLTLHCGVGFLLLEQTNNASHIFEYMEEGRVSS